MAESKKKPTKKIIDVSHPDDTAPSDNSKSVIVTNRPIMKDPMMVGEESSEDKSDEKISAKSSEAVIAPLKDAADEKETEAEPKTKTTKPKKSEPEPEPKKEDGKKTIAVLAEEAAVKKEESETKEPETESDDKPDLKQAEPEDENQPEEPASEEAGADEKTADDKADESDQPKNDQSVAEAEAIEAAEQEKHDSAIKKLVDSKQYNLPINSVEKRRSKRVVALGVILSILLVLLWIDIALDASLIEIQGIKPVTHFFSN